MTINLYAAWIGILCGCLTGILSGLFFHNVDWLGGYASWRRRMMRLGHISFFGLGFLNLGFALTTRVFAVESGLNVPSTLLLVGAVTMPLVCFLAAWKTWFRHLFFIPVGAVTAGVSLFLWRLI